MKRRLLFISILIVPTLFCCHSLFAQQILNGDFETWSDQYHAIDWIMNRFAITDCYPPPYHNVSQTSDRYTGNWAAKLKSDTCNYLGFPVVYVGFMAYGDGMNPNLAYGMPYSKRPGELDFNYKFNSVGKDTGFARIALRLLDSIGNAGDTVGEGNAYIIGDTNNYTFMSVPVNYYRPDTPQIIEIIFTTSKTLEDRPTPLISSYPGMGANAGTTLLIDDVSVSGGTLGLNEPSLSTEYFKISPNPATNHLTITTNTNTPSEIIIYDIASRKLMEEKFIKEISLNIAQLAKGVYLYQVTDTRGMMARGKVVKE